MITLNIKYPFITMLSILSSFSSTLFICRVKILPSWTVREIVHFYIFSESQASYH